MAEQPLQQTIEMNEVKELIEEDNDNMNKNAPETVYGFAMKLESQFVDTETYEPSNMRLTVYWLFQWVLVITWGVGGNSTTSIICIAIYVIVLIIHLLLLAVVFIKKGKSSNTFSEELNLLLGIRKKHAKNIYDLDTISTHFVGPIFFVITLNMTLILLFVRIRYPSPGGSDLCGSATGNGEGACLLFAGMNSVLYPTMGVTLALLTCQLYTLKDDVIVGMMRYKDEQILTIQKSKIAQKLNQKISEVILVKWQNSLQISKRRAEYAMLFIPAALWICYIPESYDNEDLIPRKHVVDIVLFCWLVISGSLALSVIFLVVASGVKYFQYPKLIMRALRHPIEGDTVQDFVVWWQLRKYYIENEVRATGRVLNVFLTSSFVASVALSFSTLSIAWDRNDVSDMPSYFWKFLLLTAVLFIFILGLAQNASTYYEEQLRHKEMLFREKLRIEAKNYSDFGADGMDKNDDGDMRTRNDEQVLRVIEAMIVDLEHTVVAIEMVGVKITPNIMLLIRGYIASAMVAAAAAFF